MSIKLSDNFNYSKLLIFTLPSIFMSLLNSIYGIIDGFFVSNLISYEAFAAINIIWPFEIILGSIGFMIGSGGSVLVSKTLGEHKNRNAKEYFSFFICFILLIGIIFSILGISFIENISNLFTNDKETLRCCIVYGKILFIFLPSFILQNSLPSFLIVAELPHLGFIITLISGLTNIILDYISIKFLNLNIFGVAVATGFSQFISSLLSLFVFIFYKNLNISFVKFKINFKILFDACLNGISEMFNNISYSIVSTIYNIILIKNFDIVGVNAYGVIMYIGYIFVSIFFGYSMGISPVIGYNYGNKNNKELNNILKKSFIIIFVLSIMIIIVAYLNTEFLTKIFISKDIKAFNLTIYAMKIYILTYLFCGFNIFITSFFTSLNNGILSGFLATIRTLVFPIINIIILPFILGLNGIWYSNIVSEIFSLIVSTIILLIFNKKYKYFNIE